MKSFKNLTSAVSRRLDNAKGAFYRTVARVLTMGTLVRWEHGESTRFGMVQGIGYPLGDETSVQVRGSATGKVYWIYANRITGYER
jgi:hypothetical protein